MSLFIRLGSKDRRGHILRGERGKPLCGYDPKDLWVYLGDCDSKKELLENFPDKPGSVLCSACRAKLAGQPDAPPPQPEAIEP